MGNSHSDANARRPDGLFYGGPRLGLTSREFIAQCGWDDSVCSCSDLFVK